jgi:hypothetical protein
MGNKYFLVAASFLIALSSCSQSKTETACEKRIDQLYDRHKLHLIFCSYYFDKVNKISGADIVLDNLSFYRDTTDVRSVKQKDSIIVSNLKKNVCKGDTSVITQMDKWCEVSEKIAEMRTNENFTLEGYMEFLNSDNVTRTAVSPFLKNDRTIYSLSTNELEMVYFKSIDVINSLPRADQEAVLRKLKSWDFK